MTSTLPVQILKGTATQHQDGTSLAVALKLAACRAWPRWLRISRRRRWCCSHLDPRWDARPASANTCSQFLTDWKHGAGPRSMPAIMVGDGWVALPDHADAVSPTRPMGCNSGLHCAGQTQPSHPQWELCEDLRRDWRCWCAQNDAETLPHSVVMPLGALQCVLKVAPCATRNWPLSLRTSTTTASTPACLRYGGSSGIAQPVLCSSSPSASRTKAG